MKKQPEGKPELFTCLQACNIYLLVGRSRRIMMNKFNGKLLSTTEWVEKINGLNLS